MRGKSILDPPPRPPLGFVPPEETAAWAEEMDNR